MNKTKIIVPTLALAMGAALAGSVSGTVAWFQYATRAQASYIGATAHCSELLQIQATAVGANIDDNNWKNELGYSDINAALTKSVDDDDDTATPDVVTTYGSDIVPITAGGIASNAALPTDLYRNPLYQEVDMAKWCKATVANYVQFELHFHVKDVDGKSAVTYLAKKLYLKDLSIVSLNDDADGTDDLDIYKAIRVHVSDGTTNALFANGVTSTTTAGALDLNNDTFNDKASYYEWNTPASNPDLVYGSKLNGADVSTTTQSSINAASAGVLADDSDPYNIVAGTNGLLGTTAAANDGFKLTVTIWLEGWQPLGASAASAMWDPATYIGQKFGVGFRFACEAHVKH